MNKSILKQLQKKANFSLQADGESMLPLLHPKDLVNYQKIRFPKIKTNDLILVFKNNLAFTHRVIYKTDKYLISKGDNNLESDGKINPNQIIGKVTSVKRKNTIIDPEMIYLIQSSIYFKEIVKIVDAFKKNNISYVFLKGLPIHLYYEKTHPRRIYQDADVLIDKKDYEKIKKILTRFGYKSTDNGLSPIQKKLRDKIFEIAFYKLINGFPVVFDIHFEIIHLITQLGTLEALYPHKLIDKLTNEMLVNKKQITINEQKFFILNTQYLILFLAFHFFRHNFKGPFRLELLDKVICKSNLSSLSINRLIDTVEEYRLQNFIYPVFYLLKKHFNTPAMEQWNNGTMEQYINKDIFNDEFRIEAGINRFKNLLLLSPQPFYMKIIVLINPKVIYMIIFVLSIRLKNLLKTAVNQFKLKI